ncbi:ATP-binding protein [Arthrobacter sp. NEB 688]|uniref:sensor histidine kinase n=1 Tax=Arthrobacter sp. NEB 688 TaxID=904039 RepID=UPI00156497F0|nr:ATP-binding protein [Arthrobacter sp. NEB 688]QKE82549.1 GAF domain-containing protein [Arthrobacter sp. NEB 688]
MTTVEERGAVDVLSLDDVREILDRQTEVLEMVAGAAPLTHVLGRILVSLERLMPGARCSVLLLDRDRGTLHHGAAPSLDGPYVAAIDGLRIGEGQGSCGTAAALDEPIVAVDVRTDPRWTAFRHLADAAGLRSCWSTPIEGRDGRPVGTFAVYHPHPHRPGGREQLLVDRFTHLASVAIGHSGLIGDLVESEERFRRSFDANSLGMAILGPDRTVTTGNPALTALAGGADAVLGRPVTDLLTPVGGSLGALLDALDPDAAAPVVAEALLHRRGRPDVEVEVTVSRLPGRDGTPARWVVNVLDLTERRAAERHQRARLEAETARRTAERLSHGKSELLAALGHEARTPLQAIVGFAELLGTMDLDEGRRREALAHIDAAAGHVLDLLGEVLDLSRLEAGALPIALEPVPLREVVDEVLGLLSATAARREVELLSLLGDDVVLADRRRLRQVLLNLVGNSIRYGSTDGVVRVRGRSSDARAVAFSVDDDGPGIAPEVLPRVFAPFVTSAPGGDASSTPGAPGDAGGVGLGLGLAHGLVVAMGGTLEVGATGPDGTSMLVHLPRAGGR